MKTDSFPAFKELAEKIASLQLQAVIELTPQVQDIIASGSQDIVRIERTLDLLLDSACTDEGLLLFKILCRHYWEIDTVSTAGYINAYREIWDTNV